MQNNITNKGTTFVCDAQFIGKTDYILLNIPHQAFSQAKQRFKYNNNESYDKIH